MGQNSGGQQPSRTPVFRQGLGQGQQCKASSQQAGAGNEHAAAAPARTHDASDGAQERKGKGAHAVEQPDELRTIAKPQEIQVEDHGPHTVPGQTDEGSTDQKEAYVSAEQAQHAQVVGDHCRSISPFSRKGKTQVGTPSPAVCRKITVSSPCSPPPTVRCSKSCQVVSLTSQNSQDRAKDARDKRQC